MSEITPGTTTLNVDFDGVPDQAVPISPGVKLAEVFEVPVVEDNKNKDGTNIVVKIRVVESENPDDVGKQLTDYISSKMQSWQTRVKRLAMSCGVKPGASGLDLNELLGKRCKVLVRNEIYTNPLTGESRETSKIGDYVPVEGMIPPKTV